MLNKNQNQTNPHVQNIAAGKTNRIRVWTKSVTVSRALYSNGQLDGGS